MSIIPRGIGALGYTIQRPTEDRYLMTRDELERRMAVLLGGRAAEGPVFGHLPTGAADDLARASDIARSMVTRYGMVSEIGHMTYETRVAGVLGVPGAAARERDHNEETAREIDCAVRAIVGAAYQRATDILAANRALLEEAAGHLLEAETLDGEALAAFLRRVRPAPAAPTPGVERAA